MKLTDAFQSFLHKKSDTGNVYLSLFLDEHTVAASFWRLTGRSRIEPIATSHRAVENGQWKDRIIAIDALLGLLEEKTHLSDVTTTILGLSSGFLTPTGEIKKEVRHEIKRLSSELALTIAGFVPLTQAVIYKLKTDEGIPPSVILLGINASMIAVSLYKIGALVGVRDIEKHEDVAGELEQALKSFTEMEVLPARILLYGSHPEELEEVKAKLMKHPWTTKANFLHFPKIEVLSVNAIIESVSLAGASEMKTESPAETPKLEESEGPIGARAAAPIARTPDNQEVEQKHVEMLEAQADADNKESFKEKETSRDETTEEVAEAEEILREDFAVDKESHGDANVVMVDAESLGFKKDADVLEEAEQLAEVVSATSKISAAVIGKGKRITSGSWRFVRDVVTSIKMPQKIHVGAAGLGVAVLALAGLSYWLLPKATVTVLTIPQAATATSTITIDPAAAVVDIGKTVVPGRSREQSVSGEKTVAVQGKKNVGDPARGTVTIYNKSLSTRSFKKGTVLSTGSLKFTLDVDVEVASASESIGSITFGKKDVAVTAFAIGTQSNLAAGSEFTFADVSSSAATARNEAALTGGTSREVTVVTRSDYEAFVKNMSTELTAKAQKELAASVMGGEQMIEETIKTKVLERVFDKEIDEEATQLNGNITISISGTTYSASDIRSLLVSSGSLVIADGYTLDEANSKTTLTQVQAKKDGSITARVTMEASLLPTINAANLPKAIAGKSIKDAETYLRGIPGVGGMEVRLRFSPMKNRLPANRNNISVTMSQVQ